MPDMTVAQEASGASLTPAVSKTAAELFHEHSGWLYGYCLRLLRSPEEAEDAVQATYLNACRSLGQGTRPKAGSAWLLRIAQNVCFTRLRSSRRRAGFERVEDFAVLEEVAAAPDRSHDALLGLTDALITLPERQRQAILLREWQGLSHSEVADALGVSQSAAETLIFRARRSLADALENPGKRIRLRPLHALDIGGLLAALKGFVVGGAGAKAVAAVAVAIATTATVVATDPAGIRRDDPEPVAVLAEATAPRATITPGAEHGIPLRLSGEAAERPAGQSERAVHKAQGGRATGQATAAAATAKPKGNGNGKALGLAKDLPAAPASANGRGVPTQGRPDSPGSVEPPPQAKAIGLANGKAANAQSK